MRQTENFYCCNDRLSSGLKQQKKVLKTNVVSLVFLQLKDFVNSKYWFCGELCLLCFNILVRKKLKEDNRAEKEQSKRSSKNAHQEVQPIQKLDLVTFNIAGWIYDTF